MMIRPATEDDIPAILAMGLAFMCSVPPYDQWPQNPDALEATAQMMVTTPDYIILVAQANGYLGGMLGMAKYRHPLTGEVEASEMFWWVEPQHRGRVGLLLIRAGEQWAKDQGATILHMVAPNPDVEALYQRMGYSRIEVSYHKRLESPKCIDYTTRDLTLQEMS